MELPVISVKAIKRILIEETNQRFMSLVSLKNPDGMWMREFLSELFYDYKRKIEQCETHEQLDSVVSQYLKMSLSDWIESL